MTDLPQPSVEGGEPTTEAGRRLARHIFSATDANCEADILAIEAEARASEQAAPPLDVERLAEELYRETIAWSSLPDDRLWAEAPTNQKRECRTRARRIVARLGSDSGSSEQRQKSTADLTLERSQSKHTAWCILPDDHEGACDGDQ